MDAMAWRSLVLVVAATSIRAEHAADERPKQRVLVEGLKNGCASGLATICCKTLLQPFSIDRDARHLAF